MARRAGMHAAIAAVSSRKAAAMVITAVETPVAPRTNPTNNHDTASDGADHQPDAHWPHAAQEHVPQHVGRQQSCAGLRQDAADERLHLPQPLARLGQSGRDC